MKNLKNFGLSLFLFVLFVFSFFGQLNTGFYTYNESRRQEHLEPLKTQWEYLFSGHFISSVSENMESEFLQMALFVYLSVYLYQKGSAESRKLPEELTAHDIAEENKEKAYSKKKLKEHPLLWHLYQNSLTLALLTLFFVSMLSHGYGSLETINEQRMSLGELKISYWQVFGEPEFWFESFQNWQSEFFSIFILGLFSIFLRQKHSPQSKRLFDPHWKTKG